MAGLSEQRAKFAAEEKRWLRARSIAREAQDWNEVADICNALGDACRNHGTNSSTKRVRPASKRIPRAGRLGASAVNATYAGAATCTPLSRRRSSTTWKSSKSARSTSATTRCRWHQCTASCPSPTWRLAASTR
jgi:hypothetical protein